jgi:hypothetical protein
VIVHDALIAGAPQTQQLVVLGTALSEDSSEECEFVWVCGWVCGWGDMWGKAWVGLVEAGRHVRMVCLWHGKSRTQREGTNTVTDAAGLSRVQKEHTRVSLHSHDVAGAPAEVEGDAGLICAQVVDVEHQLWTTAAAGGGATQRDTQQMRTLTVLLSGVCRHQQIHSGILHRSHAVKGQYTEGALQPGWPSSHHTQHPHLLRHILWCPPAHPTDASIHQAVPGSTARHGTPRLVCGLIGAACRHLTALMQACCQLY